MGRFGLKNQGKSVVHTDKTLELGVSPLVKGVDLLLMLPSSVACGAMNCSSRYAVLPVYSSGGGGMLN